MKEKKKSFYISFGGTTVTFLTAALNAPPPPPPGAHVELTLVEVRVRIAKAPAFRKPDNGLRVRARIVERAVLGHQADGLVGRQTLGRAQAVVFRHRGVRHVAPLAAPVAVDPVFRAVADVRARMVRRYNIELKTNSG